MQKGIYLSNLRKIVRAVFEIFISGLFCSTSVFRFSWKPENIINAFVWHCVWNWVFLSSLILDKKALNFAVTCKLTYPLYWTQGPSKHISHLKTRHRKFWPKIVLSLPYGSRVMEAKRVHLLNFGCFRVTHIYFICI